ncbi:AfsR/SARP family transcriptional regulator [Pseudonocardia kunmingensis]|nr:BTAD domain-containing putative transcriptional regulator [Pseudonocardia kunmingensis]
MTTTVDGSGPGTSAVEFRLLGPLEIVSRGRAIPVPPRKQRVLLAMLLLRADRVVPVRELGEKLWDQEAPADPRGAVQKYVMRLRRALACTGCVIRTEPEGYRLELRHGTLDVDRFGEAVERGTRAADAGDLEAASAQLAEALGLWRAVPPMSNVVSEALHRDETPRLVERYLQVVELRVDLDLRLGRHAQLCAELMGLTRDHPLRERFWVQRMRALYGAHRQGEALETYRIVTRMLAEDLGVDPGPELRAAHQQILTGVDQPAAPAAPGWAPAPAPRQLPMATNGVVGRTAEIAEVVDVLAAPPEAGAPRLVVLTGPAGTGKTTVAVQAAHRVAERFPDGQLFASLDGPGAPDVEAVLASFLRALGAPAGAVPAGRVDAAALFRSMTAGRRLLVVLDGAADAAVVRALLPGAPTCAVLATSRCEPADLLVSPGAHRVALGMLAPEEAHGVLRDIVGDRVRAEPDGVARLVEHTGGLPLALRRAAVALLTRPGLSIAAYLGELGADPASRTAP